MNVGSTGGAAAVGSTGASGASAPSVAKGAEASVAMQGNDAKSAGNNLTDNSINQTVNNYTNVSIKDESSQISTSGFVGLHNMGSCSSQPLGSSSGISPVGQSQEAGLDMEKLIEMIIMMMMLKMMNEMMGSSSAGSSGMSG